MLRVELYDTHTEEDILINEVLVQEHHAMKCEEPYQSRVSELDHLHMSFSLDLQQ